MITHSVGLLLVLTMRSNQTEAKAEQLLKLDQGGVHQLFIGNLADGRHSLKAVINARAANNRFVRREIVHDFRKQPGTLRLQMTLNAKAPDYEPEVSFVEWK